MEFLSHVGNILWNLHGITWSLYGKLHVSLALFAHMELRGDKSGIYFHGNFFLEYWRVLHMEYHMDQSSRNPIKSPWSSVCFCSHGINVPFRFSHGIPLNLKENFARLQFSAWNSMGYKIGTTHSRQDRPFSSSDNHLCDADLRTCPTQSQRKSLCQNINSSKVIAGHRTVALHGQLLFPPAVN